MSVKKTKYHELREAGLCVGCRQPSKFYRCYTCAEVHRARNKKSRDNNPDTYGAREAARRAVIRADPELAKRDAKAKRSWRLKLYGLTHEEYLVLYDTQQGRCALCAAEGELVVDHCHTTGRVRGLLCRLCNSGLGMFKDDTAVLAKAIAYLG